MSQSLSIPPASYLPNEEVHIPLHGAPSSRGLVTLSTRSATANYFKLFGLRQQDPFRQVDGGYEFMRDPGRTRKKHTGWFRIAYESRPGRAKPHMARFRLSSGWKLETLAYLSDYLNTTEVPWLYLTNTHGNALSRGAFRAVTPVRAAA